MRQSSILILTLSAVFYCESTIGARADSIEPFISQHQNPVWERLLSVKRTVRLVYYGNVVRHLPLGNARLTREGREGTLKYEVVYAREKDAIHSLRMAAEKYYVNGNLLANEVPKFGKYGLDTSFVPKVAYVGAFPRLWGLYIMAEAGGPIAGNPIQSLVNDVPAGVPLHTVFKRGNFSYEMLVQPNAGFVTVLGSKIPYTKMQVIVRSQSGLVVSQQVVLVNDSIIGRVIRATGQDYMDDGSAGDGCDISLITATMD
jgi:hypothetical protein